MTLANIIKRLFVWRSPAQAPVSQETAPSFAVIKPPSDPCPKCGKSLGKGVTRCWSSGCNYVVPVAPHVAAQQSLRAQERKEREAAEERSIAREERVAEQRASEAAEQRRIEKQIQRKRDDDADEQEGERASKHRDNLEDVRRAQAEIDRAEESQHRPINRDAATNDALLNYLLHEDDGVLDIQDLTDFEREELRYNGGTRRKYRKDD